MAIQAYLPRGFSTWHLQPLVGLGAPFSCPRLEAAGSVAHCTLRDRSEQGLIVRCGHPGETLCDPFGPDLYGVFEAQLPRVNASLWS